MAFVFLSFKYDWLCMHLKASVTIQTMSIALTEQLLGI